MIIRSLILTSSLLFPVLALAQQPPDPATQALGQMVLESVQREVGIRAQLISAQAKITALEAAAKTSVETPKAPPPPE